MSRGFSLLEVVVATSILVIGVAGVAPLLVMASRANQSARFTTMATLLAQQKMEQLRALEWSRDPAGVQLSDFDTDLTAAFASAGGGSGLGPSPAGSLDRNVDGFYDFIATDGRVVGGGAAPSAGVLYVRRWSIGSLPPAPAEALLLEVLVTRDGAAQTSPENVRLTSVRVRGGL